ncbi:zinc finger protein 844-like [Mya arenaria]|uniref:zinc finger protein 844-like n=1 Tax=Mya arenaria TaxID=6604 RepID=UPI0022E167E7|nr:zinc finger protein 844-like [Mya arenaria]
MVQRQDSRHLKLSQQDRRTLAWTQTPSRRQILPAYPNSAVYADKRMTTCKSCGRCFADADDLNKHVALNHTGSKPAMCHICGQRFGSERHLASHFRLHKEPRLQEFNYLRRRQNRDPTSETQTSSDTTVGSFNRIPKAMKGYASDPSFDFQSFGTHQTFRPSEEKNSKLKLLSEMFEDPETPRVKTRDENVKFRDDGVKPNIEKLPKLSSNIGSLVSKTTRLPFGNASVKTASRLSLPKFDAGGISVIDSVMGPSQVIKTNKKSHFVEDAEEEFIKHRMEEVSLAGRTPTPKSFRSISGIEQYKKPTYLNNNEFWDNESHVTGKQTVRSPVSGYDPYVREDAITKSWQGKSVRSFPR